MVMKKTLPPASVDPYAAIRALDFSMTPGREYEEELPSGSRTVSTTDEWVPADGWNALGGFGGKYNLARQLPDGRLQVTYQKPGAHKYDTLEALYAKDADGKWTLQGDPTASRQTSSRDKMQDFAEKGALMVGTVLGAGYGISAMAGGAGAGAAAGTGTGAAATGGATNAALIESAVGAGGYGASSAGLGGGATASWGAGAGYTADAVASGASGAAGGSTGGYWNGTDFGGAAPQAGSSVLGPSSGGLGSAATTATGAKAVSTGLSVSDWLGLGSVAAGLLNKPKTPDTSGLNAAAADSASLARDSFDWFKSEYEKTAPDRAAATSRDNKIGDAQLEAMKFATQEAKDASARNKTVFQPLEDKMVADAVGFDTPARRAAAVAETTAGVESAFGRAQQGQQRTLMRMSSTPNVAANAALMQDASLAKAKAIAGETAATTRNVEQQGHARLADATALGKGVISNQATQQQIAANAGNSGVNAGAGQVAAANSGVPIMQAGTSAALQGLATAGNLYGQAMNIGTQQRGQDYGLLTNAFNSYMRYGTGG